MCCSRERATDDLIGTARTASDNHTCEEASRYEKQISQIIDSQARARARRQAHEQERPCNPIQGGCNETGGAEKARGSAEKSGEQTRNGDAETRSQRHPG